MSTGIISFSEFQRTEIIEKLTPIFTQNVEKFKMPDDIKKELTEEGQMQMIIDKQISLMSNLTDEKLYIQAKKYQVTWTR